MDARLCYGCGQTKLLSEFSKTPRTKLGVGSKCKECRRREYREERERLLASLSEGKALQFSSAHPRLTGRGLSWSIEEEERLRENYPYLTMEELLPLFPGRTVGGIRYRSKALRLRKGLDYIDPKFRPDELVFHRFTECEKYYLAGIIDGEGYVGLAKRKGSVDRHNPCVTFTNSSEPLKEWVDQRLPDCTYTRISKIKNRKPLWVWHLGGPYQVKIFLQEIVDCLIVKRKQALLLIEYDDAIAERRIEIYQEMRRLNRKGAPVTD